MSMSVWLLPTAQEPPEVPLAAWGAFRVLVPRLPRSLGRASAGGQHDARRLGGAVSAPCRAEVGRAAGNRALLRGRSSSCSWLSRQ